VTAFNTRNGHELAHRRLGQCHGGEGPFEFGKFFVNGVQLAECCRDDGLLMDGQLGERLLH
jgi:hypothetical protein